MRRMELETLGTRSLLRRLVGDAQSLVRRELQLVRTEVQEDIGDSIRGGEYLAAGGLLGYAGAILLLVALAFALASTVPPWVTTLVLGLLFAVVGAILALIGRRQIATPPLEKTRESLEEDVTWAKRQLRSSER